MTALPTTQALADANIDSLERLAIALGLFFAQKTAILPDNSPSKEAITFRLRERASTDPENPEQTLITSSIEFECFFKLQADAALEGGILLENIEPFFALDAPTFPESPPSLLDAPALPTIPDLDNAEQLMVWALLTLNASIYPENQTFIQIAPTYGDNELKISFQFPLDSQALSLNSYQAIAASKRIVNQYLELDTGAVAQIGLDAYQVAVTEGFLGTRAEWLLTLVGPAGPQGIQGNPGTPGAGVSWRGIWNSATTYAKDEAIDYQGSSYIANATTTNELPGVSAKWDLWVAKGEPGPVGPAGPQGIPGQDSTVPGPAGTLSAAGSITLDLVAEPATPAPDKLVVWASALDGLIYKKDENGIVEAIGTGGSGGASPRDVLTANKTVWVKSNLTYAGGAQVGGDDTTGDGTENNPWLTITKLSNYIATVDLNGYNLVCHLNGSFGTEAVNFTWKMPIGSGSITIKDSLGNKNNTKLIGQFYNQAASVPLIYEQITFENKQGNNGAVNATKGSCTLKNCRIRGGYFCCYAADGFIFTVLGELIFRFVRQSPGISTLDTLFYAQWKGLFRVEWATIKTVTDDSDTVGSLVFSSSMFCLETLGQVHARGATFTGTGYSANVGNWLKSQQLSAPGTYA